MGIKTYRPPNYPDQVWSKGTTWRKYKKDVKKLQGIFLVIFPSSVIGFVSSRWWIGLIVLGAIPIILIWVYFHSRKPRFFYMVVNL